MSDNAYYLVELFDKRAEVAWDELLAFALERANFLEFAAPRCTVITGFRLQKWQWKPPAPLQPFLVNRYESYWKYQVRQKNKTLYYRFRLTPEMATYVLGQPLEIWGVANDLPEDPAFYRDELPILWTISHEQFAYVWLNPAEAQSWREAGFANGIRTFTQTDNRHPPTKRP
jgi:hypothetical protein